MLIIFLSGFAALIVGLSKGGIPTIGMIAVPLLSIVMPPTSAAVLLLPIYVISDIIGVYLYHRSVSRENLKILIPAGIVGVVFGWIVAAKVSNGVISLIIGLTGISYCLKSWLSNSDISQPSKPSKIWGYCCGIASGFTSFISHSGAPPYQIYILPQKLSKTTYAGTSTIFFAVINATKIIPYQNLQPYSIDSLKASIYIAPIAVLGTLFGAYLTKYINEKWFLRLVQISLFFVSIKLLFDATTS